MTNGKSRGIVSALALLLMGLASLSSAVYAQNVKTEGVAQNVKVEGVIKGRSGDTLLLQTSDSPKLTVLLTQTTDVGQLQGALKARQNLTARDAQAGIRLFFHDKHRPSGLSQ
jgi:predicted regulator of Ras-like GTPase activity (Roadblock/LC7/MglB family)